MGLIGVVDDYGKQTLAVREAYGVREIALAFCAGETTESGGKPHALHTLRDVSSG